MSYEKQNFQPGQILTAAQLNHIEDGVVSVLPTVEGNEKYLAVDKDGSLIWEDRYGYTYYEESILCPQQSSSNTLVIYGSVFAHDCTIGETYEVICNGVTYSAICRDWGGLGALGNLKMVGAGDDTGEVFCIAGANIGIATIGLIDSSIAQEVNTLEVRGKKEIVTQIPSKYLGGGLALGSGSLSCAMNGIPSSSVRGMKSMGVNGGVTDGDYSFACNLGIARGGASFAAGHTTEAFGQYSAVFNYGTKAKGKYGFACGSFTNASGEAQFVCGRRNIEDTESKYAHIVGNGTSEEARSNAYTLDWNGNAWYAGTVEGTAMILKSSTEGSTKRFKITVDDSGTISATEIIE